VFQYILKRFLVAIPTVLLVTVLTFVGLRLFLPTGVVDFILSVYGQNDPALKADLEERLGLSSSIPEQYADWLGLSWFFGGEEGVLQGNLGQSLYTKQPVMTEIKRRLPVTLELGLWGQFMAVAISVPLGIYAAVKQDKWPDYGLRSFAILLSALPSFWIAILVITFGSLWFHWAPEINFTYLTEDPVQHLKILLPPALIIGLTPGGGLLRLVRAQMLEVLRQDYMRTARAKGLANTSILMRHALRNAMIPVVTVIGVGLPNIIAGTVIFETIFVIPGMGRYLITAINNLDYPVIQALNLVFAILLVLAVIAVDIAYALLDPRIRFGRS
jgi:peptide/nickel transport system permease protein